MLTMFEGTPGAGKTCYSVREYLIPAVKAGRRGYVCMRGIYLDRWALLTGIPLAQLQEQVTVLKEESDVYRIRTVVVPVSFVLLHEAQN